MINTNILQYTRFYIKIIRAKIYIFQSKMFFVYVMKIHEYERTCVCKKYAYNIHNVLQCLHFFLNFPYTFQSTYHMNLKMLVGPMSDAHFLPLLYDKSNLKIIVLQVLQLQYGGKLTIVSSVNGKCVIQLRCYVILCRNMKVTLCLVKDYVALIIDSLNRVQTHSYNS